MKNKKVMVGMSGGVDSSVAAALLMESGYDVSGVTLRLYDGEDYEAGRTKTCCSLSDVEDARLVCCKLGIKHYVFNFKERFENSVINDFISEYENGRTPNPCIVCNRRVKFGDMLERAKMLGYDKIATGHYARVETDENGRYLLRRPQDKNKDQTYVLYSMTQDQLSRTLFPLGELSKPDVRKTAEKFGFVNASKPDSQDICFVPDGDYAAFIERRAGKSPSGNFVDKNGNILGKHNGVIRYTVGQRKGLGIALGKPTFVIDKNPVSNNVTLGDEDGLFYRSVFITDLNYIPFDDLKSEMRVTAKLRYRHAEQSAVLKPYGDSQAIITFDEPQRAPSPGQAAVFYNGDIVVGGGTIVKGLDR